MHVRKDKPVDGLIQSANIGDNIFGVRQKKLPVEQDQAVPSLNYDGVNQQLGWV